MSTGKRVVELNRAESKRPLQAEVFHNLSTDELRDDVPVQDITHATLEMQGYVGKVFSKRMRYEWCQRFVG